MTRLRVPVDWEPRDYQLPVWQARESGTKRIVKVWHRRAGKDVDSLNWSVVLAAENPGIIIHHMLPSLRQGRKVIWQGRDKGGRAFLSYWPERLVAKKREDEMSIELSNGSFWQVVGGREVDALVGSNPRHVVFSEYPLMDPAVWDFYRPILLENGGSAEFDYTPRGRNHGFALYEMARDNPNWFTSLLTIKDTGVLTEEDVENERLEGMPDELIEQEFYCSFNAQMAGSYYGKLMAKAEADGRITDVPHDPALPVQTWWDIGIADATAIWFMQVARGGSVRAIDYFEAEGEGLDFYLNELERRARERGYSYDPQRQLVPHDFEAREFGAGKTRVEQAQARGWRMTVVQLHRLEDGIDAVRRLIPRVWFDKTRCRAGIETLQSYRKKWSERLMMFLGVPEHDEASHGADAFRTGAMHDLSAENPKRLRVPANKRFGAWARG